MGIDKLNDNDRAVKIGQAWRAAREQTEHALNDAIISQDEEKFLHWAMPFAALVEKEVETFRYAGGEHIKEGNRLVAQAVDYATRLVGGKHGASAIEVFIKLTQAEAAHQTLLNRASIRRDILQCE